MADARYNASAFYSQQSAEKALKSRLFGLHDVSIEQEWGHSVMDLLARVHQIEPLADLEELERCARIVDRHYIGARYPNAYPSGTAAAHYDEPTALDALESPRRVLQLSALP